MTSPLFSILIPTRDRGPTFTYALQTVVAQAGNDFEIVVADNASGPDVKEAVDGVKSCPITYVRSDQILPMTDNWIKGLEACKGRYITVLGDDDGLMPSALSIARLVIDKTKSKLISWNLHNYWWPDSIVEYNRNYLFVKYTDEVTGQLFDSRKILGGYYSGQFNFDELPMLYNSFVHRDILEETKKLWGSYIPVHHVPDVTSGIFNLYLTESYMRCFRPLAIRANSGKSNGTSFYARSRGKSLREKHYEEEKSNISEMTHPDLIPSPNLLVILANNKLRCRDLAFPRDPHLRVDIRQVVYGMLSSLNDDPAAYEENLAEAMELAEKHAFQISPAEIPDKALIMKRNVRPGVSFEENGNHVITINGNLAGISDVNGACRLAESLLPPL